MALQLGLASGLALLAISLTAGSQMSTQDQWEIFPGDGAHGVNVRNVHDPKIFRFGKYWFCISTNGFGFGGMRRSTDLIHWDDLGAIIPTFPKWLTKRIGGHSIWAPDAIQVGSELRIYYCASARFGANDSAVGLMVNDHFDPTHPHDGWVDKGDIIDSLPGRDDFNAIDPEVLIAADGTHWLYFGSYWGGIQVMQLNPSTGLPLQSGESHTCVARNTMDHGDPIEGSAICRHGDYYYLFVSYGLAAQGVRSTYRIMVGRSENPAGPFVDEAGKSMVNGGHVSVLATSPPMFAPGHCSITALPDGKLGMVYHFYDGRRAWVRDLWGLPTLQIRDLLWSSSGWPLPGLPIEFQAEHPIPAKAPIVGEWTHQAGFGDPETVTLHADGTFSAGDRNGTWKQTGEELDLNWPASQREPLPWVDHLQLAYNDHYYVGRNQNGLIIRGFKLSNAEKSP